MAKQVGIKVAQCKFAHNSKSTSSNSSGIISYSIINNGEKLVYGIKVLKEIDAEMNSFTNYCHALSILKEKGIYNIDLEQCKFDLFKILIFDFIVNNCDRHYHNLIFIANENKDLRVAPIFDNELSFGGTFTNHNVNIETKKEFKSSNLAKYLAQLTPMSFPPTNNCRGKELYQYRQCEAKEIVNIAMKNPKYKKFMNFALKSIDINKANQTLKEQNIDMGERILWYNLCLKHKKDTLNNAIIEYNNQQVNEAQNQSIAQINQ